MVHPKCIFLLILALELHCSFKLVEGLGDYKCKGLDVKRSENHTLNMNSCAESIKLNSMEDMTMEKMQCFNKCFMEKEGLVDKEGKPHKENIGNIIDSTMPEEFRVAMKERTEKCLDEYGNNLNPQETSCASYGPLTMCTHKALIDICV